MQTATTFSTREKDTDQSESSVSAEVGLQDTDADVTRSAEPNFNLNLNLTSPSNPRPPAERWRLHSASRGAVKGHVSVAAGKLGNEVVMSGEKDDASRPKGNASTLSPTTETNERFLKSPKVKHASTPSPKTRGGVAGNSKPQWVERPTASGGPRTPTPHTAPTKTSSKITVSVRMEPSKEETSPNEPSPGPRTCFAGPKPPSHRVDFGLTATKIPQIISASPRRTAEIGTKSTVPETLDLNLESGSKDKSGVKDSLDSKTGSSSFTSLNSKTKSSSKSVLGSADQLDSKTANLTASNCKKGVPKTSQDQKMLPDSEVKFSPRTSSKLGTGSGRNPSSSSDALFTSTPEPTCIPSKANQLASKNKKNLIPAVSPSSSRICLSKDHNLNTSGTSSQLEPDPSIGSDPSDVETVRLSSVLPPGPVSANKSPGSAGCGHSGPVKDVQKSPGSSSERTEVPAPGFTVHSDGLTPLATSSPKTRTVTFTKPLATVAVENSLCTKSHNATTTDPVQRFCPRGAQRDVGVQVGVEVVDRSASTSPSFSEAPPSSVLIGSSSSQSGGWTSLTSRPPPPPPLQHICRIDIELRSRSEADSIVTDKASSLPARLRTFSFQNSPTPNSEPPNQDAEVSAESTREEVEEGVCCDAEKPQEVAWDERGMTWEVYGASVDLQSLGTAIQTHLESKVQNQERRIRTLRKSVCSESSLRKYRMKKRKRTGRGILGCCRKNTAVEE